MRKNFLGCPVDLMDRDEILRRVDDSLVHGSRLHIEGVNVAKVVQAQRDPLLMQALEDSDLVHVDGKGVEWAMRLLGEPVPARCAGIDLMMDMVAHAAHRGAPVYLLGSKRPVVERVEKVLKQRYRGLTIAGISDGYFDAENVHRVVDSIAKSRAKILLVGISSPKKELFVREHHAKLGVNITLGVGGSFDVISGALKRAPGWMQRGGLEWAFRALQEPRRLFRRYLTTNSAFLAQVMQEFGKQVLGKRTL